MTIEAPAAHHPDQVVSFVPLVDTAFAADGSPLTVSIVVSLHRMPRQRCSVCGKRRICYFVGIGGHIRGPVLCAKCSGIR